MSVYHCNHEKSLSITVINEHKTYNIDVTHSLCLSTVYIHGCLYLDSSSIQMSLKAQSCTLSWLYRASRDGSLSTFNSCCLSADWEKSSGPSPQPPSWG